VSAMPRQAPALSFGASVALLVVALSALLLPFGGPGSLDRAEPYFMYAGRAMVEQGDWLVPLYRDQPFFDKPILGYWVIALCFRLFGCSAEAARIGPALFAILTLLVTIKLGALVGGRRVGLFAGVALATTAPFVSFGRTAMADMPMTFFSTAAVVLALVAWNSRMRRDVVLPALGAALGLGFAAKGPIAVLLPGLAILALAWHKRREKSPLAPGPLLLAVLLFRGAGIRLVRCDVSALWQRAAALLLPAREPAALRRVDVRRRTQPLLLSDHVSLSRTAVVAVPARGVDRDSTFARRFARSGRALDSSRATLDAVAPRRFAGQGSTTTCCLCTHLFACCWAPSSPRNGSGSRCTGAALSAPSWPAPRWPRCRSCSRHSLKPGYRLRVGA